MNKDWSSTGINAWIEQTEAGLLTEIELKGAGANTGDSTWTYSSYNAANPTQGTKWDTPGGDYDTSGYLSAELGNKGDMKKIPTKSMTLPIVYFTVMTLKPKAKDLNLTGFALVGGPDSQDHKKAAAVLKKLNSPYMCAVPLVFQSFEEWQAFELGLHPIQIDDCMLCTIRWVAILSRCRSL